MRPSRTAWENPPGRALAELNSSRGRYTLVRICPSPCGTPTGRPRLVLRSVAGALGSVVVSMTIAYHKINICQPLRFSLRYAIIKA